MAHGFHTVAVVTSGLLGWFEPLLVLWCLEIFFNFCFVLGFFNVAAEGLCASISTPKRNLAFKMQHRPSSSRHQNAKLFYFYVSQTVIFILYFLKLDIYIFLLFYYYYIPIIYLLISSYFFVVVFVVCLPSRVQ